MENDNNNSDIGSASSNAGSFEGSVSADGPGSVSSDRGNIESSMSAENGGGISNSPQVGTLDLDPNTIGSPLAVMDSRLDPAGPSFLDPSLTTKNLGQLAVTLGVAVGASVAAMTVSPAAAPALVTAFGGILANADVLANAARDAQASMGKPGAFVVTGSTSTTIVGDPVPIAAPVWSPEQGWFAQWMPNSGNGGGGSE